MSGPASTNVSHGSVLMAVGAHFSDRGKEDKSKGTKARAVRAKCIKGNGKLKQQDVRGQGKGDGGAQLEFQGHCSTCGV